MFIYNPISSVNQKAVLHPGLYQGNAALYADSSSNKSIFMAEYREITETCICAVELFIYQSDGSVDYRNFVKLENGFWRNNLGETESQLSNFLPKEILDFRVCKNMTLLPRIVGQENMGNTAIFVTDEMRKIALELMPVAQSLAEASTIRVSFFKTSQTWLKIQGGKAYSDAKASAQQAHERLNILFMIAKGIAIDGDQVITCDLWREVVNYFIENHSKRNPGPVPN